MRTIGLPRRIVEAVLWVCGTVLIAIVGMDALQAHLTMGSAARGGARPVICKTPPMPVGYVRGELIGRLEIPKVGLSVPVLESYDPATLVRGVGHVPGTAVPGGLGNMVLAGHRDTFFRPLRNVRTGMKIDVGTDTNGTSRYLINSTEVITPDQVQVTEIGDTPGMTLITCFPFDYVGAAPRRFIARAHLLSVNPA